MTLPWQFGSGHTPAQFVKAQEWAEVDAFLLVSWCTEPKLHIEEDEVPKAGQTENKTETPGVKWEKIAGNRGAITEVAWRLIDWNRDVCSSFLWISYPKPGNSSER